MRRLFAILISAFLVLGSASTANAAAGPALNADRADTTFSASALTLCSENSRFQERASSASTAQDKARFERYGEALCGDEGLPHLIIGPTLEPFGALFMRGHEGDVLIPAHLFIFIAGMIGWSGREYLKLARESGDAAEKEIFLDPDLMRQAIFMGSRWPERADIEARSGQLRENNKHITTSPESDFSDVAF